MKTTTAGVVSTLAAVAAAKDSRTFAVLRFNGDGFLTEGRMDPIVNPGGEATHYHGIMGGSNFDLTVEGEHLLDSNCTTAKIANDFSNYWVPGLFFQDPKDENKFTKVPVFYMNVYYFFEATNDKIKAFPAGLKMLIGDADNRSPPKTGGLNLFPNRGEVQPVQFTCTRTSYNPPSYPPNSDGSTAGIQDPDREDAGAGFPLYPCDGFASPLRMDIHFPSCYNPKAGLDDYKNNMAWPEAVAGGKQDCPEGYIHVPHMFYEVYWNTALFDGQWTPDGKSQPFVLSNGDATGYSAHADFIAGWDAHTLQTIIDTCDAGSLGMDTCPQIPGGLNTNNNCKIAPMIKEPKMSILSNTKSDETLGKLPGNNPVTGWGKGGVTGGRVSHSESSPSDVKPVSNSSPVTSSKSSSAPTVSEFAVKDVVDNVVNAKPAVYQAVEPPAADSDDGEIVTIWDVVTVTATATDYVASTPAPGRRNVHPHAHGHLGRHPHYANN
ncbi:hypothetical protein DL766_007463 [Monosporascus sp. MC13-8B]|uniref:DUF1996 domain-containing protein n=1 Tax=Monosporascus cannonballus TaxID=155416 RepID=A0ABY0GTR2_9PEZI|nr:hypothetical protein DL762_009313 [Monosporascus cannonballus]RYO82046.1 hypothetical protein DL763_008378 [Monosporascus cannonballus]RYP23754.1 hypothetical protein DL766_007463 [Monosporascus sp. MC13-8B]